MVNIENNNMAPGYFSKDLTLPFQKAGSAPEGASVSFEHKSAKYFSESFFTKNCSSVEVKHPLGSLEHGVH